MVQQEITKVSSAVLGASQAQGTLLTFISAPGKGRWKVWGTVRHSLADGILLRLQGTGLISRIPNAPNGVTDFGPIIVDIINSTDALALDLAVATGGSDSASGVLYAQRLSAI